MFSLTAFRQEIPSRTYGLAAVTALAVVVLLWCVLTYGGYVAPIFLPSPTDVWNAAAEVCSSGVFAADFDRSCARVFGGFAAAVIVSIPIGILMGNFRVMEAALEPFLAFVRYMPVPAFIPLIILYAGIDEFSKMLVIFIGTALQMIIMVSDVVKKVAADLCKVALTLGATPAEIARKVVWRASLPGIVDVCRINLGWAWTYLIVAEVLAANQGLGFRIIKAQHLLNTSIIFFYLVVIGALGLACDIGFRFLGARLFPWTREYLDA
ncbi:MAG: ABC transporter permease [Pseudomonadota bacterium]|nr:ABC transporter permease [Pseudomonadota bacterium]